MKKLIYLTISVGLSIGLQSQTPEFKWGEECKIEISKDTKLLGGSENLFYIYDTKAGTITNVSNFSTKKENSKKIIPPTMNGKDVEFEDIVCIDNQPVYLAKYRDKKEGSYLLLGFKINSEGSVETTPFTLDVIKNLPKGGDWFYKYAVSEDGKRLLVFHRDEFVKGQNLKYSLKIIDKNLSSTWSKEFELTGTDKDPHFSGFCLDKDNNTCFFTQVTKSKDQKQKGELDYFNKLVCYNPKTDKSNEIILKTTNYNLYDRYVKSDGKGNFVFASLCSVEGLVTMGLTNFKTRETDGAYIIKVDKNTLQTLSENILPIANDMGDKKLYDLYAIELVTLEDGTSHLICEHKYIGSGGPEGPTSSYTGTSLLIEHSDQVLFVTISSDLKSLTTKKIIKRQTDLDEFYNLTSCLTICKNNDFGVVINRDAVELSGKIEEGTTMMHNSITMHNPTSRLILNSKFNSETNLFSDNSIGLLTRLKISLDLNNTIVIAKTKNGYKFGKMTFK